ALLPAYQGQRGPRPQDAELSRSHLPWLARRCRDRIPFAEDLMVTQSPPAARTRYEADGFSLHPHPVIPADLVGRTIAGQDALRRGEYETGTPPPPSYWNPGDDPAKLCKIEM